MTLEEKQQYYAKLMAEHRNRIDNMRTSGLPEKDIAGFKQLSLMVIEAQMDGINGIKDDLESGARHE